VTNIQIGAKLIKLYQDGDMSVSSSALDQIRVYNPASSQAILVTTLNTATNTHTSYSLDGTITTIDHNTNCTHTIHKDGSQSLMNKLSGIEEVLPPMSCEVKVDTESLAEV